MENVYSNVTVDMINKSDIEQADTYETLHLSEPSSQVVALPIRQRTMSYQQTTVSGQNTKGFDITWCRIAVVILISSTLILIIQAVALVLVKQMIVTEDMSGVTLTVTDTTTQENIKSQVCDQPPYVAHSRCIVGGNSSGSMAMCACNDGYYLDGIPAVFCQSDGDWSPVKFSCKRDCGQPPNIPFARRYVNSTYDGSIAKYECFDGFQQAGNPIFRCRYNGNWTTNRFECLNTQIRLAGGANNTLGRVEINYFGIWGTVCDDGWDDLDAIVVCKQLGFRSGIAKTKAFFGQGKEPTWMDNVLCTGKESRIELCPFNGWSKENCAHNEDAGVVCIKG